MTRTMLTLMLSIFLLAACGGEEKVEKKGSQDDRLAAMQLSAEPAGVVNVIDVKGKAKEGDEVVVFGRIRKFGDGYASFILTGDAMRHCREREGDMCKTPWDYCCEESGDVAMHSLNVEFRNGDRPFKKNIEGTAGLELLSNVVVKGKVAEVRDGSVTLAAEGFFIRP